MSQRNKLFLFILAIIILVSFIVIRTNSHPVYKKGSSMLYDSAISASIKLYRTRLQEKVDLSSGPCLTNDLMPGWVVDIVHSPREAIDDLPQNQCQAFLEGRADHFVELDQNGNIVRVR